MLFGFLLILCHAYILLHPYQCAEESSTKYIYTIFLSYLKRRVNIVIFYLIFVIISVIYMGWVFFPLLLTGSCLVILFLALPLTSS